LSPAAVAFTPEHSTYRTTSADRPVRRVPADHAGGSVLSRIHCRYAGSPLALGSSTTQGLVGMLGVDVLDDGRDQGRPGVECGSRLGLVIDPAAPPIDGSDRRSVVDCGIDGRRRDGR